MKLAMFKNFKYTFEQPLGESFEGIDEYIRISEYVEVEFPPIKNREEVINKEIEFIEEKKKEILAETQLQINELDERIANLLALPGA